MSPSRNELLIGTASLGLILGLNGRVFAEESAPTAPPGRENPRQYEPPPWIRQALERMRASNMTGVVIVVPAGANEQRALGAQLQALLASNDYEVQELFARAVWACAPRRCVEAKPDETVVLLDPAGKRVEGARMDFSRPEVFIRSARKLLGAKDLLAEQAHAQRTFEVDQALKDLGGADFASREKAERFLRERFPTCAAAVLVARQEAKDAEVRVRCENIVGQYAEERRDFRESAPLPYGTTWKEEKTDPCPPCGMARMPETSRKLLTFLTQ